jgi:phenylalanyl-tRNA synthetase beta chain
VLRDLALVCDNEMPVCDVEEIIRKVAKGFLETIKLFDIYTGEQVPTGKKSVAYGLRFRSLKNTLKDEAVDKIMIKIIRALEDKNIVLR